MENLTGILTPVIHFNVFLSYPRLASLLSYYCSGKLWCSVSFSSLAQGGFVCAAGTFYIYFKPDCIIVNQIGRLDQMCVN